MHGPFSHWRTERKLARLQRLSLPQDQEILREELAKLPEYACYNFNMGWPHTHEYTERRIDRSLVVSGRKHRVYHSMYELTCACGMIKMELRRERCRIMDVHTRPRGGRQEFHRIERWTSWTYHTEYLQPRKSQANS